MVSLEPGRTVKFNINGMDYPAFISVIPAIIDFRLCTRVRQKENGTKIT